MFVFELSGDFFPAATGSDRHPLLAAIRNAFRVPLDVQLNLTSVRPGNELQLTVTLTPEAAPMPPSVDAYVVLRLPDGSFFSLTASGGAVPGIQPIATGFTPVAVSGTLLRYGFTGAEPLGAYAFFGALTQTGTIDVIGTVGEADFTVGP